MITTVETRTTLRLIDNMLDHHDDRDHPGTQGHLTAARTQIAAVRELQSHAAEPGHAWSGTYGVQA